MNDDDLRFLTSQAPLVRHIPACKIFLALYVMCDETWAMSMADARKRGEFSLPYYLGNAAGMWTIWVIFVAVGASGKGRMTVDLWTMLTIAAMGAVTYGTRLGGFLLLRNRPLAAFSVRI